MMGCIKRKGFLLYAALLLFFLGACALPGMIAPNPANPIKRVAVLPMYNATNDIDGPVLLRELVLKRVKDWQYQTQGLNETDQILRDRMGVTLGSQLELTNASEIGKTLGVDGVIYGYLLNFETVTTGVYNAKRVRAGLKLVDTRTGRTVWARGLGVKSELTSKGALGKGVSALQSAREAKEGMEPFKSVQGLAEVEGVSEWRVIARAEGEDVGKAALFSLGEKLAGKMLGTHLKHESEGMLNMVFADFPAGPGASAAVVYPAPDVPEFEMKGASVPAYMDFGERDFTSDIIMTSVFRDQEKKFVVRGRLAKRGDSMRTDLDMTEAMKKEDKDSPVTPSRWTYIQRAGEMKGFTLYPEVKKYLEVELTKDDVERPAITKQRLGEEALEGIRCVKYRVTVTEKNGTTHKGLTWEAVDLANFVIRSEFEEKDYTHVMELKNLRLATPAAGLFQIPKGYVKASGFTGLFGEER